MHERLTRTASPATADLLERLTEERRRHALPPRLRERAEACAHAALALLFPHFAPAGRDVRGELAALERTVAGMHSEAGSGGEQPTSAAGDALLAALPMIHETLLADARAMFEGDPAATSLDEVILAYPGFFALGCHRIGHVFYEAGEPLFARLIAELAHRETGIDIHPGATLGRAIAIDHGTGVVIGETAVLGDRVKLYQGVTLGALSVDKALARTKRHPTIEDDVVIYANATILGGQTVVGAGSVIGGNVWLTRGVAPGSIVTHAGMHERRRSPDEDLLEFNI